MSETPAFVASLGIKPGLHKVRARQIHLFRHFYGHTNPEDLLEIGWIGLYFREDFILEMFRPHSKKLPDVLKLHGVTAYLCDIKKKTLTATVNTVRVTLLDNWMTQLMSSDDAEQTVCDHCLWVYHFKNYKRRFFFLLFFFTVVCQFWAISAAWLIHPQSILLSVRLPPPQAKMAPFDGLWWHFLNTLMVPRCCILMTLVNPFTCSLAPPRGLQL